MNRSITKTLEMAARVQDFVQAHPFTDRNQTAVAAQFEERLARAQTLFLTEHAERLAANSATQERLDVRRGLETESMQDVARIGVLATEGIAGVASRFAAPRRDSSDAQFLALASSLLEAARAHQDTLISHGLVRGLLSELAGGLTRFRAATAQAQAARRQHRETRVNLGLAVANLNKQMKLLDVFNRGRFRSQAGLLGTWTSIRTVASTSRKRRGSSAAPTEATPPPPATLPATPPVAAPDHPMTPGADRGDDQPPRDRVDKVA